MPQFAAMATMAAGNPIQAGNGFTLIEVLVALGLCALLAAATTAAIGFSGRAERLAMRSGEAALLMQSLYSAQRLRPDEVPAAPPGWGIEQAAEIATVSEDLRQEWHVLAVAPADREIPPVLIRVLDAAP